MHAWAAHPRLGGCAVADDTAASDLGTLIHGFLLGEAAEIEIIRIHTNKNKIGPTVPATDYRTKEAQELRDAAREAGKLPVLEHVYEAALAIVDPLRNQLDEVTEGAFSESVKEVTALWESGGVLCKARMDALHLGRGLVIDLKFLANAHPVAFGRSMVRYGYDLQHASYLEAVGTCHPELAGRVDFQFLLIEVDPHSKVPARLGDRFVISSPVLAGSKKGLGEARWARAKAKWRACLESGSWPAYEAAPIEAAPWELQDELNAGLSSGGDPSWLND
ncbi:MAG TPA: PD-(D/E)XK nuclease-like domain-containing protein [Thermoanaerobaculia bacterium]|nr:PD-(D/E)XK nuclease-like domain-containing protein [Thermoanaerobaculia bacterium]